MSKPRDRSANSALPGRFYVISRQHHILGHVLGEQIHVGLSQGDHWYGLLHKISHQARQFIIDPHPDREWTWPGAIS